MDRVASKVIRPRPDVLARPFCVSEGLALLHAAREHRMAVLALSVDCDRVIDRPRFPSFGSYVPAPGVSILRTCAPRGTLDLKADVTRVLAFPHAYRWR